MCDAVQVDSSGASVGSSSDSIQVTADDWFTVGISLGQDNSSVTIVDSTGAIVDSSAVDTDDVFTSGLFDVTSVSFGDTNGDTSIEHDQTVTFSRALTPEEIAAQAQTVTTETDVGSNDVVSVITHDFPLPTMHVIDPITGQVEDIVGTETGDVSTVPSTLPVSPSPGDLPPATTDIDVILLCNAATAFGGSSFLSACAEMSDATRANVVRDCTLLATTQAQANELAQEEIERCQRETAVLPDADTDSSTGTGTGSDTTTGTGTGSETGTGTGSTETEVPPPLVTRFVDNIVESSLFSAFSPIAAR